jgi:IS4 transposase
VRIFKFILACLIYNAWVLLNAKAREHVTTLAIKLTHLLNYILTYLTLQLTEIAPSR